MLHSDEGRGQREFAHGAEVKETVDKGRRPEEHQMFDVPTLSCSMRSQSICAGGVDGRKRDRIDAEGE